MRDVFWTIVVVWLIYKIYNGIKGSRTYVFQKHEHYHETPKEEGKITIEKTNAKKNSKDDEFTDYEEVK